MANRMISRAVAGTVLMGSLAFAVQVAAQQQGQTGTARQERVEGRGGRGQQDRVEHRLTQLNDALKLSVNQTTAIRQILLDEQTKMEALRPEGMRGPGGLGGRGGRGFPGDSGARGERRQRPDSAARAERQRPDSATMAERRAEMEQVREQIDALRTQTDARIEAVLNADQKTAYRELVAKRPEGGPGRGGPGGPGGFGRGGRGGDRQAPPPSK